MLSLGSAFLLISLVSRSRATSAAGLCGEQDGAPRGRALAQTEDRIDIRPEEITQVSSFKDLKRAWTDGAAHIEVTSHLDAMNFPLIEAQVNNEVFQHLLPMQLPTTRSVRGNCSEPPSSAFLEGVTGAPMLVLKPRQCIILAHEHIVPMASGAIWWDNMYLRYAAPRQTAFAGEASRRSAAPMLFHSHGGSAWVTNTTIQGDGGSPCGGIVIYPNAALQFVDTVVHSMVSTHKVASSKLPPVYVRSSSVAFLRCRFENNSVPDDVPLIGANEPGTAPEGSADDPGAALRFQECSFTGNNDTMRIQAYAGVDVFSDNKTEVNYRPKQGDTMGPPVPVQQLSLGDTRRDLIFCDFTSDPAFLAIQQQQEAARLGIPAPPSPGSGWVVEEDISLQNEGERSPTSQDVDSTNTGMAANPANSAAGGSGSGAGGGLSNSAVGGIVAAAVVLAIVSVGAALWAMRTRTRTERTRRDKTPSSRPSYLIAPDSEKSDEAGSEREFVKTALGRAGAHTANGRSPFAQNSGSMGSMPSSAQSITSSGVTGRNGETPPGVPVYAGHLYQPQSYNGRSIGVRSAVYGGSGHVVFVPLEQKSSNIGSGSPASQIGHSQLESMQGHPMARNAVCTTSLRGHSPASGGLATVAEPVELSSCVAHAPGAALTRHEELQRPQQVGLQWECAAHNEPYGRLLSSGKASSSMRGSRSRRQLDSPWQNVGRHPVQFSSSGRMSSGREDGMATGGSEDTWGTAADLSIQSNSHGTTATPSTAVPSAAHSPGVFGSSSQPGALPSGSPPTAGGRHHRRRTSPPQRAGVPCDYIPSEIQVPAAASPPLQAVQESSVSRCGAGESGSEQNTRILPSPEAEQGTGAAPAEIVQQVTSIASAEPVAVSLANSGGMEPVGPPVTGASLDDRLNRLCRQLDSLMLRKIAVLGEYVLLGMDARRQGGQGVVQFARSAVDAHEHALKFFVSSTAFDLERRLYSNPTLGVLLPRLDRVCSNEDGAVTDAFGEPLPSFIVMEKGEALDEWSRRAKPDLFQSVAMLANIAKRLEYLHNHGYVHRDLKPSNVMWLPRENRWTVIDFGCAARIGRPTSISFSLHYAAPEVIEALTLGAHGMVPQPALDSWSLGVLAFELLTGTQAFDLIEEGPREVVAQLGGARELPWEGGRAIDGGYMRKLRAMRGPVLSLLHRDAAGRLSLGAFCNLCDDIFATRTMHAIDASSPSGAADEARDSVDFTGH